MADFPPGASVGDDLNLLMALRLVERKRADLKLAERELASAERHLADERRRAARQAGAILPSTAR